VGRCPKTLREQFEEGGSMATAKTIAVERWVLLALLTFATACLACSERAAGGPSGGGSTHTNATSAAHGGSGGTSCGEDCSDPSEDEATSGEVSTTATASSSTGFGGTAGEPGAGGAGGLAEQPSAGGAGGAATTAAATTYVICRNGGIETEFCLTQEQMETQARFGYWPKYPLDPPRSEEEIAEGWDEQGCLHRQWVGSSCCNQSQAGPERRGDQCCYISCEGEGLCCGETPTSDTTSTSGGF
jgi:hypothetical protein